MKEKYDKEKSHKDSIKIIEYSIILFAILNILLILIKYAM